MTRLSHAAFIRRVAAQGTRQPFYEALRLTEAADRFEQLEFENARFRQAISDVMRFLHAKGIAVDEFIEAADAEQLICFSAMLDSVRAAMRDPVALPPVDVSGEYDPRTKQSVLDDVPALESRMRGWASVTQGNQTTSDNDQTKHETETEEAVDVRSSP